MTRRIRPLRGFGIALLLLVPTQQALATAVDCNIPGYVFKTELRPVGASVAFLSAQQQPTPTAALAACNTDPACMMFTTDGWLIGIQAYFSGDDSNKSTLSTILDPQEALRDEHIELAWGQPYCGECNDAPGCCASSNQGAACCGTYVAAVTTGSGGLALQQGPSSKAPAHVISKACSGTSRVQRGTVVATQAPCIGDGLAGAVTMDSCNPVFGDCAPPQCTVQVLGAALDDAGQKAMRESKQQAIKVDRRCGAMSLQEVHKAGHTACCARCWISCCALMIEHIKKFDNYPTRPIKPTNYPKETDPCLNFPSTGGCSAQDTERSGSCCEQLAYVRENVPLGWTVHSDVARCTLECARKCGFKQATAHARTRTDLWCVMPQIRYAGAGQYPTWVKQQYLVKHSTGMAPPPTGSAADKHECSLC